MSWWEKSAVYECGGADILKTIWGRSRVDLGNLVRVDTGADTHAVGPEKFSRYLDVDPTKEGLDESMVKTYLKYLCHNARVRFVYKDDGPEYGPVNNVIREQGPVIKGFRSLGLLNLHVIKHVLGFVMYTGKKSSIEMKSKRARNVYEGIYRYVLQDFTPVKLRDWEYYRDAIAQICPTFFRELEISGNFLHTVKTHYRDHCDDSEFAGRIHQAIMDISEAYEEWVKDRVKRAINGQGGITGHLHGKQESNEVIYAWTDQGEVVIVRNFPGNILHVVTAFFLSEKKSKRNLTTNHIKKWIIKKITMDNLHDVKIHANRRLFAGG